MDYCKGFRLVGFGKPSLPIFVLEPVVSGEDLEGLGRLEDLLSIDDPTPEKLELLYGDSVGRRKEAYFGLWAPIWSSGPLSYRKGRLASFYLLQTGFPKLLVAPDCMDLFLAEEFVPETGRLAGSWVPGEERSREGNNVSFHITTS